MKVAKRLGLRNVSELRDLLMSPRLYLNNAVYTTFALAFESGVLRGTTPADPKPLEVTLSVSAEAHFRAELWFSLAEYDFGHKVAKSWLKHRKSTWQKCCEFVFNDREANKKVAWETRLKTPEHVLLTKAAEKKAVRMVQDPVDPKYW